MSDNYTTSISENEVLINSINSIEPTSEHISTIYKWC